MSQRIKRAYLKRFNQRNQRHVDWRGFRPKVNDGIVPPSLQASFESQEAEATKRIFELWQSDFWQGVHEYHRVIQVDLPSMYRIYRYFSGNFNFFVKEDYTLKIIQRSIRYSSKEQAMRSFRNQDISWQETFKAALPSLLERIRT